MTDMTIEQAREVAGNYLEMTFNRLPTVVEQAIDVLLAATDPAKCVVPDGWQLVPKDIHPLDTLPGLRCDGIIRTLALPPQIKGDPTSFYSAWWDALLAAAPKQGGENK